MPRGEGFEPSGPSPVYFWRGSVLIADPAITWYPELRYRGYPVSPYMGWKPETPEPMLGCYLDTCAIRGIGHHDTPGERAALLADGWHERDGFFRYVHVDEIEKSEGPPPDGPF